MAGTLPIKVFICRITKLFLANKNIYSNLSCLKMANELTAGAQSEIKKLRLNKQINIEAYKENADVASGNCSGIM